MIEIFFAIFLFGLSVVPGIVFWNKDFEPGTIPWRFKNQLRYKNVKAREIEFSQRKAELETKNRQIYAAIEVHATKSLQTMEDRLKTDPEHLDWDGKFDAIDREEREAKAKAEKIERDRKIAEDLRLAREAELEQRRIDEAHNNTFLQDHGWNEHVVYVKAIYARINARTAPTLDAPVAFQIEPYQHAPVVGWVYGQLHHGSTMWYKLAKTGTFVHSEGFQQPSEDLPDLNEYETETLWSAAGPVQTIKTRLDNPWKTTPPAIESVTRNGTTLTQIHPGTITADKITSAVIRADKITISATGGISGPNFTIPSAYEYDLKMEEFELRKDDLRKQWEAFGDVEPSFETVMEMNEIADEMDAIRAEQEIYETDYRSRNAEKEQYKAMQRRIFQLEQEKKRRNEEEERARRRRREEEDRQRNINLMNTTNSANLAMMVATGLI